MKVEVALKKWGTYSKGETLEMNDTTAKACIKSGAVKKFKKVTTKKK